MIESFKHKGLRDFYETGSKKGVQPSPVSRYRLILGRLNASLDPADMDLPGLNLHPLKGNKKDCWAVSVSGNWRITFKFLGKDAVDVDLIDYH